MHLHLYLAASNNSLKLFYCTNEDHIPLVIFTFRPICFYGFLIQGWKEDYARQSQPPALGAPLGEQKITFRFLEHMLPHSNESMYE
jgi:hypothetical protein